MDWGRQLLAGYNNESESLNIQEVLNKAWLLLLPESSSWWEQLACESST